MKILTLLPLAVLAALVLAACTGGEEDGAIFAFDTRVSLAVNDPYEDNDPRSMRMQYGGIGEVFFEYAFAPHVVPGGDTVQAIRLIPTSEQGDFETEYALLLPDGRAYIHGPKPGWRRYCGIRRVQILAVQNDREILAAATARQVTENISICDGGGCVSEDRLRLRFELLLTTSSSKAETKGLMPWGSGVLRCEE